MRTVLAMLIALAAAPAAAEVSNVSEHGFTVNHTLEVGSDPSSAWRMMTRHVDQWWSKDHTWSGRSDNLYMDLQRGGCFCEKFPDGGEVEHLRIIYFMPASEMRFEGALGPLQTMPVNGRMTWKIEEIEGGSRIVFTYHVTGHPAAGLAGIAPAVDGVIGEQLARLGERLGRD